MVAQRVGFCIVLNGMKHLSRDDFNFIRMANKNFDCFVFAEGIAGNGGSTSWCRGLVDGFHKYGRSIDGTLEYLKKECENSKKIFLVEPNGFWKSKDEMVNACLMKIKENLQRWSSAFLWQIDSDEKWNDDDFKSAEKQLVESNGNTGCFHADYFVGPDLVAKGCWGEGNDPSDPIKNAYRRLWIWDGRLFAKHEPPMLYGGNGMEVLLPQRFKHYAYLYPEDVKFKEAYYTGHENILKLWKDLQKNEKWPQPLSTLISGPWGQTATTIQKNIEN